MIRKALLLPLLLPLGGCVSLPAFHLPHLPPKAPAAASAAPVSTVCPASITADLKPMPPVPDGASIPAAQTPEASAGFAIYLAWLHSFADWGKEGWTRAAEAKAACSAPPNLR